MKINNQYSAYRDAYQSQVNQETAGKEKATVKKESVEINLSSTSKQIRLSDQVEDLDNSKKLANIKQAIKEGSYKVSSEKLANKMFDNLKG